MTDHTVFEERICAMLDGELSDGEAAELRAHLDECPECRAFLDAMKAVYGLSAKELPEAPPELSKNRVGDSHHAVGTQQLLKIARVTLGTIAYENLVCRNVDAAGTEVVFHDGFAQEVVAPLRTITSKRRRNAHLVSCFVQRFQNGWYQRLRHIPDAQRDDIHLRVLRLESPDSLGNISEQIIVR